jgi:hypothetical protein
MPSLWFAYDIDSFLIGSHVNDRFCSVPSSVCSIIVAEITDENFWCKDAICYRQIRVFYFIKFHKHHIVNYVRFQVLTAASMMFRVVFILDDGGSTHL